jgi:hypothetical protein
MRSADSKNCQPAVAQNLFPEQADSGTTPNDGLQKLSKQSGFFPTDESRVLESLKERRGRSQDVRGHSQTRSNVRSKSLRKDDKIEGEI